MKALVLALLAFFGLFIAGFLAVGEFVYDYSFSVHRFPIIVGLTTIVLAVIAAARTLAAPRPAAPEGSEGEPTEAATAWPRGTTAALLRLGAAVPMILLLGFVAGLSLYLLAYLRVHGERWLTAIAFAAGCALIVYFGFHELLAVPLPTRPFWWPA